MPRKIAFVTGSFAGGGTEHYLVRMLRHLDRRRFSPVVVTLDDCGTLREEVHALAPVHVVRLTGKLFNRRGLSELWRLSGWLRREEVDLVHALMDRAIIYGALAARLAGGLPLVASHRYTVAVVGGALMWLNNFALRHFADHVIPNSHAVVPWLESRRVARDKITVVHNGIPSDRFRPVVERPENPSPITVCTVGRLMDEVKGQSLLLEAMRILLAEGHALRLLVIGSGPDEARLRGLADRLGIAEHVEWTGYLPDPTEAIERSDICALTSYNEGFPNVVVEYFAAGRPVVATAVGGVPEVVKPEENGLLVPPGDVAALAEALRRLADDGGLRRRMGEAGRALIEAEFTVRKEIEGTQRVYDCVLAGHCNA